MQIYSIQPEERMHSFLYNEINPFYTIPGTPDDFFSQQIKPITEGIQSVESTIARGTHNIVYTYKDQTCARFNAAIDCVVIRVYLQSMSRVINSDVTLLGAVGLLLQNHEFHGCADHLYITNYGLYTVRKRHYLQPDYDWGCGYMPLDTHPQEINQFITLSVNNALGNLFASTVNNM